MTDVSAALATKQDGERSGALRAIFLEIETLAENAPVDSGGNASVRVICDKTVSRYEVAPELLKLQEEGIVRVGYDINTSSEDWVFRVKGGRETLRNFSKYTP